MSLKNDILPVLVDAEVGETGHTLFWGPVDRTAEDPDPTVEIHQSPAGPGLGSKTGEGYAEGRLQALARSENYDDAEAKAFEVRAALHRKRITAADGTVYHVLALQRPFDLGATDGTDRFVFSQNFDLTIVPQGAPPRIEEP